MAWWITFEKRRSACVGIADDIDHARRIAEKFDEIVGIASLPYPASPRLDPENEGWSAGRCPSFCYKPGICKGHTSCPSRPSCTS